MNKSIESKLLKAVHIAVKPKKAEPFFPECIAIFHQPKRPKQ